MSDEIKKNDEKSFSKFYKILLISAFILSLLSFIMSSVVFTGIISAVNTNQGVKRANSFLISKKYDKGQSLEKALKKDKDTVVFFYVDWCGYCKRFAPQFVQVIKEKKYKENFAAAFVNCDDPKNADLIKLYDIKAFPTLFMITKTGEKKQVSISAFYEKDPTEALLQAK